MKNVSLIFLLITTVVLAGCQGEKKSVSSLKTQMDSLSYGLGLNLGKSLAKDSVDINPDLVAQAIRDVKTKSELRRDSGIQKVFAEYGQQRFDKLAAKNKKDGEAFLAANKVKDGVVTLPDGLQYRVLVKGTGRKPTMTDKVTFHYRGMLVDGKEFDSSYKKGSPATAGVGQLIPGWTEALLLMPAGSKWELFVPSNLAYGEQGFQGVIGPNSTLIFELELLSVD